MARRVASARAIGFDPKLVNVDGPFNCQDPMLKGYSVIIDVANERFANILCGVSPTM